jgi:hypothetical protein
MPECRIARGSCRPLFIFEVGQSIDLESAARRIQAATERQALRHRGRPSTLFEYRPAPLRISQDLGPVTMEPFRFGPTVDLVLYDFGAASVTYTIPIDGPLIGLLGLSIALRGHQALIADARRRVTALVASLGPAVQKPRVAEAVEDYFTFQVEALEGTPDAATVCTDHAEAIARVLRAERDELSDDEIADAIEERISFGRHDLTVVDWDSAFILDPDPDELRTVFEFANVQLLELRYLDSQLDQALERSYQLLARQTGLRVIAPAFFAEDLRQVAELQVDSAVLLERVTNALKFFGEEYLARLYRLVSGRLHLADWDSSITRKLQTIESLYQKMADRATGRRMELLEWVVIVLIALEIIIGLRN